MVRSACTAHPERGGRTMTKASNASGNAGPAKARALYGRRLRAEDYRRLMGCRTMSELAAALKEQPLYSAALADVNPQYARRAQLESLLRQSLYTRYDSLCQYSPVPLTTLRICKPYAFLLVKVSS